MMDNKHSSLHLSQRLARIFILGHYQVFKANSFPQALLSQTCSRFRTNNVRGHCLCQLDAFVSVFPLVFS